MNTVDVGTGSASANAAFGVPPVSQQQADYNALFSTINKGGGILCHPLAAYFQDYDETNSNDPQTECLQFVQAKVFAELVGYLPGGTDTCLLQNHIPVFEQSEIAGNALKSYYPYYFSIVANLDVEFHNFAHAAANMGYFGPSKGFKKLGIEYRDCITGEYQSLVGQLESVGVSSSAITSFDFGCTSEPYSPPNQIEQAILQFEQDRVSTVITMDDPSDLKAFTTQANNQGFKPQYMAVDTETLGVSESATGSPNASNFNGAIAITPDEVGAIQSDLPEDAATKQCDQIMTSHGLPTVYQTGAGYAGTICNLVRMLAAAMTHDSTLSQGGLAAGLARAGSVPFSYPNGPNNFQGNNVTYGGEFWRPLVYQSGCACWKVTNPNFSPSFP